MSKEKAYEMLVTEFNNRVDHYNKGKRTRRWEASNPEDRDAHGRECGFIYGLEWAINMLSQELK